MKIRIAIITACCVWAFAASAVGPAKPKKPASPVKAPSATDLFRQGFGAYQAFKCEDALRLFAKGVAQSPDAKAYYFMGNCERWRANRTAAADAYDRGLKLAPQGSPVRADLESAKASLAVAFDPALQTKLFYEAARRAGIEPPEGLQAAIDPRLVPVHLDWEWESKVSTISPASHTCPYGSGDDPSISRIIGGISTSSFEYRCYERAPDKNMVLATVFGFGLSVYSVDRKLDGKNPAHKGRAQYRDATGWKYVRDAVFTSSEVPAPDSDWLRYQETSTSDTGNSAAVIRCQYKPSTSTELRGLSDGPQLEVLCATKSNKGDIFQSTSFLDLVSGMTLDQRIKVAGVEISRQISGHIGRIGETLTRVETSDYGSGSTTSTKHLTRTR